MVGEPGSRVAEFLVHTGRCERSSFPTPVWSARRQILRAGVVARDRPSTRFSKPTRFLGAPEFGSFRHMIDAAGRHAAPPLRRRARTYKLEATR
jgi:hypothetical protein